MPNQTRNFETFHGCFFYPKSTVRFKICDLRFKCKIKTLFVPSWTVVLCFSIGQKCCFCWSCFIRKEPGGPVIMHSCFKLYKCKIYRLFIKYGNLSTHKMMYLMFLVFSQKFCKFFKILASASWGTFKIQIIFISVYQKRFSYIEVP